MKIDQSQLIELLSKINSNTTEKIKHWKHIALTGPSGSGKSTIIRSKNGILHIKPQIYDFSVSAATRAMRKNELHGVDYHFMDTETFHRTPMVEDNAYLGNGKLYGTLVSEVHRITVIERKRIVLDLDINGGIAMKKFIGGDCLFVFLRTPETTLYRRLKKRQQETGETDEQIDKRILVAQKESARVDSGEVTPDFILPYDDEISPGMAANEILLHAELPVFVSMIRG